MERGEWPVRVWPEEECMQRVSLRLGEEFGSAFLVAVLSTFLLTQ